jgi:hypothetical protein
LPAPVVRSLVTGDLDRDGDVDVAAGSGLDGEHRVLMNR